MCLYPSFSFSCSEPKSLFHRSFGEWFGCTMEFSLKRSSIALGHVGTYTISNTPPPKGHSLALIRRSNFYFHELTISSVFSKHHRFSFLRVGRLQSSFDRSSNNHSSESIQALTTDATSNPTRSHDSFFCNNHGVNHKRFPNSRISFSRTIPLAASGYVCRFGLRFSRTAGQLSDRITKYSVGYRVGRSSA